MKDKEITSMFADVCFDNDLLRFEKELNLLVGKTILTQNNINALLSLGYNVGMDIDVDDIPEGLGDSTLLKLVKANSNSEAIYNQFLRWNKANGKVISGLTRRRKAEADLYFK